MRRYLALTILSLAACRSEFHAYDEEDSTTGMAENTDSNTTGSDTETDGSTTDGDTDGTGSDDTGGETDGGTTGMDEPPGPGDPCDPFLAREGVEPCTAPEGDNKPYTCVRVDLMPQPNEQTQEFRCVQLFDMQQDGTDVGDPCDDNGGFWYQGCQDSQCTSNGYPGNYPLNFPQGQCDPGPNGDDSCCLPFCDDDHPCEAGWTCDYDVDWDNLGVGTCIWI